MAIIEKGIPIPSKSTRIAVKYPFKEMEVGDSIFFETLNDVNGAYKVAKYQGVKVTARQVDGGYRVWRIE